MKYQIMKYIISIFFAFLSITLMGQINIRPYYKSDKRTMIKFDTIQFNSFEYMKFESHFTPVLYSYPIMKSDNKHKLSLMYYLKYKNIDSLPNIHNANLSPLLKHLNINLKKNKYEYKIPITIPYREGPTIETRFINDNGEIKPIRITD